MENGKLTIKNQALDAIFLSTGALESFCVNGMQLNQLTGNSFDGSLSNLYLRVKTEQNQIRSYPLIGSQSASQVSFRDQQIRWSGKIETFRYEVTFQLGKTNTWFWTIRVAGTVPQKIDIILGQDVGLALPETLLANEAYVSQYVDYQVFTDQKTGTHVTARQNQAQQGKNPYMQIGTLSGATHFSTDGYQFFGPSYKWTNQAAALSQPNLASEIYQYEFGYIALQSDELTLTPEAQSVVFYGVAQANYPDKVKKIQDISTITTEYQLLSQAQVQAEKWKTQPILKRKKTTTNLVNGEYLTEKERAIFYPEKKLPEYDENGQLLSFFGSENQHVVLREKEEKTERSHGHIILAEKHTDILQPTMAVTSYMYGVFQSQLVLGNTSMNAFVSNVRNPLNIFKTTGQRIYLKESKDNYAILGLPSAYEMGLNNVKWLYKYQADYLLVTLQGKTDGPESELTIESLQGNEYEWLITSEILLTDVSAEQPIKEKNQRIFAPEKGSLVQKKCPDLKYKIDWSGAEGKIIGNDFWFESLAEVKEPELNLLTLQFKRAKKISVKTQATLEPEFPHCSQQTAAEAQRDFQQHIHALQHQFALTTSQEPQPEELVRMNTIIDWYTLDMLIHYLSPHGLEQFGGAAWGTRDVCQGPIEFFMATQNFEIVRTILLHLFTHQFKEDGNWPQWFMFDQYQEIMANESHGDIIVWPLKVIGDYLMATNDFAILETELPYMMKQTGQYSEVKETLFQHIKREIAYIQQHFLAGTKLSCYGDGDWDDTLQPADERLKKDMASTWTVALTYSAIQNFAVALAEVHEQESRAWQELAAAIRKDYDRYMVNKEVLPGFVLHENQKFEYIIHPTDTKTGIHYRLLPMIQSITSELSEKQKAKDYLKVIKETLLFPDGVHLMNKPAPYDGGISTYFKRAEQAANFGREIGLQYVHAHIRYSESLSKMGRGNDLWQALSTINPILIQHVVKNAALRQSNAYFSSSDGDFKTRYEAAAGFHLLKEGKKQVKGGWRVYSSGPGIYLNQLITNLLGIKIRNQNLVIDPTIPTGFEMFGGQLSYLDIPLKLEIRQGKQEKLTVNGTHIDLQKIKTEPNPYRRGGYILPKALMEKIIGKEKEIFLVYEKEKQIGEGGADKK